MKHLVRFRMSSELLSMCCRCAVFFLLWLGDGLSSALRCLWVASFIALCRSCVILALLFVSAVCHLLMQPVTNANIQLFHYKV